MKATVFDDRISTLAEGPLWHPERGQLFWFDILGGKLHTRDDNGPKTWDLGEYASAAGWIDADRLLIATETGLFDFNLATGERKRVADLETDNPRTRSNDGRADPWGGFWIGTMEKQVDRDGGGAIYRFYRDEVRKLFPEITIPNSICFSHDRAYGYFSDTPTKQLKRVALDPDNGWPSAEPEVIIDFTADNVSPDGAVVDAEGNIWLAQWGASKVAVYDSTGSFLRAVEVGAPQTTCPAFGGRDMTTLYVTTAREHMDDATVETYPLSGMIFHAKDAGRGLAEPRVIL